jgi:hypothetical protein
MQVSPEFHLAPRIGAFDHLAVPTALQALSGIAESFTMADMNRASKTPAPIAPPAGLSLPESAVGGLAPRSLALGAPIAALPQMPATGKERVVGVPAPLPFFVSAELHLAPRIGIFQAVAVRTALPALSGIAESFTMADMDRAPRTPSPISPRSSLWLPELAVPSQASRLTLKDAMLAWPQASAWGNDHATYAPAPFRYLVSIPGETGNLDISELDYYESVPSESVPPAAGFAAEGSPFPFSGVFRPLYDSADFSLYPVWLPALFALGRPGARLRRGDARYPGPVGSSAGSENSPIEAEGPGFSGMLLFPERGSPYWEFRENWRPQAARAKPPRKISTAANPWPNTMQNALRIWRNVPAFARGLAIAVPLVAPALFYAPPISLPTFSSNNGQLAEAIRARAMIDLREDFQSGLGNWTGQKGWETTWLTDASGSVQPGRLALFRPKTPVTDYRAEFQGQIQSKALGFVFRAADTNNYYAAKLVIRKPGALPSVYLVRYAVVDGHAGPKTETLLPMYLRSDTLYNVLVTVQGESFTFNVNGQLVDAWSDDRLKSGGIGFFAEKGEISDIRSVHVVDNEDFLGWLCSEVSRWNADRSRIGVKHE